jgi:hypothetical protein
MAPAGVNEREKELAELHRDLLGNRFDNKLVAQLLAAMRRHTRSVAPPVLGMIGEEHLRQRLLAMGVRPESFR